MDRFTASPRKHLSRIPHTRGDGPALQDSACAHPAYSPHAWGWTETRRREATPRLVFPTRVGMDRRVKRTSLKNHGIPHTRGDGPRRRSLILVLAAYSPHAWGWTGRKRDRRQVARVFPTRVGMDRSCRAARFVTVCIPHTRGDGPTRSATAIVFGPYSPRAWGWTERSEG